MLWKLVTNGADAYFALKFNWKLKSPSTIGAIRRSKFQSRPIPKTLISLMIVSGFQKKSMTGASF
eukprot:5603012-Amphidinium_carterae.1